MFPYIGITGFMNRNEVLAVLDGMPQDAMRMMMMGVLASSQTIQGISNGRPRRYPTPDQMGTIFPTHPNVLNLVHFNTREQEFLYQDLMRACVLAGAYCHGFQLNMAWPDPDVLMEVKSKRMVIVLQVGSRAFEMIGNSPIRLAMRIEREYPMVDYVLLDASGGKGKPLDTCMVRPYFYALAAKQLPIGLVVAGGLSADSLDLVAPLVDEFPDLSLDAEGKLRDENDNLNVAVAISYLTKALALFKERS